MYKILFPILALFVPGQANGQLHWFPLGTSVTYNQSNQIDFPYSSWSAEWKVTDTATKKGKLCQKFTLGPSVPPNYEMYVYEDSGVVYWFRPKLDEFTVLYDFNKAVGESWLIKGVETWRDRPRDTGSCELVARVTTKGTDTINGFPLRTMDIKIDNFSGYAEGFDGKVIEYIGSFRCPRPDPYRSCGGVSETQDFWDIRCFDHPEIGFHKYTTRTECKYSSTSVKEMKQGTVKLSPNPGTGLYQLDLKIEGQEETMLNVYDLTGRLFARQVLRNGSNTIDISFCAAGVYHYQVIENDGVVYNGMLVKQ
jgi:hypothetical protein